MEIGGFEVEIAKDALFLAWILVVNVTTDAGFEIRGDLRATGVQLAACTQAEVTPFETRRRQLVFGYIEPFGQFRGRRG